MSDDILLKKRMMFILREDYNFLTYNIFIILNSLGCVNDKSALKDHRKLSFLIDFVSDSKLIDIIENQSVEGEIINEIDRDLLNQSFTNSLLRLKTINQLVFTLTNEDYLIVRNRKLDKLNIALNKEKVSSDFLRGSMFKIERENMKRLKSVVQRISILDIGNMLQELYYKHGVINEELIN
ncbi:hypothetical protein [Gilvibacter sediminis]|uniref:hypothetical protein n=1 Tax=Gilvibacter sediminis TaxID=379071 RepID=UPI0023505EE4|nr:hypothetical protein [Gilvibacter sediminis]MDC7997380.1 hypothetical protein [Gilvibacter sediminis]